MEIFDDLKFSAYIPFQRMEIFDISDDHIHFFPIFPNENVRFPIIFCFDLHINMFIWLRSNRKD